MRIAAICVLTVTLPLSAGLIHVWKISEIENAPLLVVAKVESVSASGASGEARLHVLRSFPPAAVPASRPLTLRYAAPNRASGRMLSDFYLESGKTILIPLIPGDGAVWHPLATNGENYFVPAIEVAPLADAATGRAFILNELANSLANGNPAEQSDAAVYLRNDYEWPEGLREVLETAVGRDDDRWLRVGWAVLANMGIPHSPIDQLLANEHLTTTADRAAAWVLAKGATRDYPDRLLRYTLHNMASNEWGATNILLEFKDSPLVIAGLTSALRSDPASAMWAAWTFVRNGQTAFQSEALDTAVSMISNPAAVPMNRLQPASWLLRDYGSDTQFAVVLTAMRRLKMSNPKVYGDLFGAVDDRHNRRLLAVDAILIDDGRVWSGDLRYCDLAAASLEGVSGQHFGVSFQAPMADRDRAVAAASAWLAKQSLR